MCGIKIIEGAWTREIAAEVVNSDLIHFEGRDTGDWQELSVNVRIRMISTFLAPATEKKCRFNERENYKRSSFGEKSIF